MATPPSSPLSNLSPSSLVELAQARAQALVQTKHQIRTSTDPVQWIETNFWIPELRGPIHLEPYQQAVLRRALSRLPNGQFRYSTIVWSDIKKSIKSCIAAAVGLWRAYTTDWGQVIVVANDLKQADSRVGYYMRRAIELNPPLKTLAKIRNYSIAFPNHASVESVSIDPTGEAGSNADMVIFSELWGAHQEAQQRMWVEMTLPPNKFGQSFRWVETYAGYIGESPLLENLYTTGKKAGRNIGEELGFPGLEVYENAAARMLVLWNDRPRMPWQTDEYYQQEEAILPPLEFQRIHRNQWVTSAESFVPLEWWGACQGEIIPIDEKTPMVFGIDAAVSGDTFGIIGVTRRKGIVQVGYVRKWVPPPGHKLSFDGPEQEIRRLAATHNVLEWAYDEFQLHDMATRLGREGVGWFRQFTQNAMRLVADKSLYDVIRERRLQHSGEPELREHIMNCNAKIEGDKLRLVKKAADQKIDLAVSLSMAAYEALRLNLE